MKEVSCVLINWHRFEAQDRGINEERPIYNLLSGIIPSSQEVIPRLPKTMILNENKSAPALGRLYLHHNRGFRLLQERALAARQSRS
jgi:hypothetical protein